jgi:4-hydroxybutyrate dehydrogenase/sulfolactaldehyde 3-reductase
VLQGDTEPGFTIDLAHKDLSLILGAAHAARVPMPVAGAVFESYSQARANGCGANDFSAMADAVCDLAKIPRARVPKGWKPA